jgi:serine/threonine protein kinase
MEVGSSVAPRILILETDGRLRSTLLRYAVKGWQGASVQSMSGSLEDVVGDAERLRSFDVLLVGCDFSKDGTSDSRTLRALRAIAADPANPAVIVLTTKGSEYTAVQAIKAGAFDYLPKEVLGREQILSAVQRAMLQRQGTALGRDGSAIRLFGYDLRRCLAHRENVSVHVAFSAERAKEVVLKILHRGRGSLARDGNFERFVDEFKLLYDIDDRAVAEIFDFRVTAQYCYIAMEYFPLGHLGTRLAQPLSPALALRNSAEIAHSLAIIHAAGVVHRDLKPANLMLREDGTMALIDFGISHSAHVSQTAVEGGEAVTGTPYYMSPEQARGSGVDERTDLYALGVILYQMLTAEKPFAADTAAAILDQHCNAPVPRLPASLAPYQPLLDRLLAKNRDQRLATAREVIETIEHLPSAPLEPPAEALAAG